MRTKYKAWAEPLLAEHPEIVIDKDTFLSKKDYYLEIGSGKGKFLSEMALNNPNLTFIGVEKNITVAGYCLKKLLETPLSNSYLYPEDIDSVLSEISDGSVLSIFLNFSDPWPKARHEKRRLTTSALVDEYYRILASGSHLYFKTDNKELYEYSLEQFKNSHFLIESMNEDYNIIESFDVETEYELKAKEKGLKIYRIILEK
ncbi:MAG: tRNA (guanosine(46)-N7)-methyltransferase TrmB [Coprobacillus sp.]|nr:tRNA (guanosine(46)-N7)-methyltransferase TrmB [Coprobacillus sp.]